MARQSVVSASKIDTIRAEVSAVSEPESQEQREWAAQFARSIVEANPGPLIAISPDGIIISANEAGARISGVPREELLGTEFTARVVEPDLARRAFAEALEKGSVNDVHLTVRQDSGVEVDLVCSAAVYRDGSGEVIGILAAARDVTEERRAQRELQEQRDRLQLVLEGARIGLWDWNIVTDEGVVDERFAEILGYTLEELTPSTNALWASLTHPDDLKIEEELTERHLKGIDKYYDTEGRMRHRDGSWVWVRDRGKVVEWNPDGTPLRMAGTLEDITEARENMERMAAAEEQFRLAMDESSIGMCLVSPAGQFLRVNPALCRMLGRPAAELTGMTWQEVTHPDDLEVDLALVDEVLNGKRDGYRLLKRFLHSSGAIAWGDLSVAMVRADDGTPRYAISQIVDVTDRHTAEQQLAEREELLRLVLENSPDPTARVNADLRVEYVNQAVVGATGITRDRWIGSSMPAMGFPADLTALWIEHCQRVVTLGMPDKFEFALDTTRGHRWAEASLVPERDPSGAVAHIIITMRDVTRRREAEAELLRLATHDPLTGLANRAVLADELGRAMQSAARSSSITAVLMVDLDRFKNVNDSLGHGTGDELLRAAAGRMQVVVRPGDLVARSGGDEFVVVMREVTSTDEAVEVARQIVEAFRAPFPIDHQDLYTTASVGVSVAHTPTSADDLVREADTAMYVAKEQGRDRVVVFNQHLRAAVSSRLQIESELRQALELGQLEVWYQPEVDLPTGAVTAVEALLRWNHPTGELRSAETFIEVAEETGLIVEIGDWVLQRACRDASDWTVVPGGADIAVRVNVSARQLAEPALLESINRALAASALEPSRLCLEITETTLLASSGQAHTNIDGARRRGAVIALDDFGTGYASLAYLREYPIDLLKIDRSFITRITSSEFDRRLVAGILALAGHLDLPVTAEGVEHEEQAHVLRELGCRGVQGYLFAEAVSADQVPDLLLSGFQAY